MKNLYVMGTPESGKTTLALGLAQKFQKEGLQVAYFKPIGTPSRVPGYVDDDAMLMKEVLQMDAPLKDIVPRVSGPSYLSSSDRKESLSDVLAAYERVSKGADVVVIGGALYPYAHSSCSLDDITLAGSLGAQVLMTVRMDDDYSLDRTLFFDRYMNASGVNVLGNVLNDIPRALLAKAEGIYQPILEEQGFNVLGIVPRRAEITSPTVEEYFEALGGELLAGENNLQRPVEDLIVVAMGVDSAMKYLRRAADKAVVIGGDRSDLAMLALETSTSVLILTGGLYPHVKVINRAQEKNVPLILVNDDTYTTVDKVSQLTRRLKPDNKAGIKVTLENIEQYCKWQEIIDALR